MFFVLSDDLQDLKNTANLTAKEIAQRAGVSESTLSRILSGETPDPSYATVSRLVIAMGGSLDQLAGISHEINYRDELIEQCRSDLEHERKLLKRILIFACVMVAFLAVFLMLDVAFPSAGWIRY